MGVRRGLARLFGVKAKRDTGASLAGGLTPTESGFKQFTAVQQMRRGVADVSVSRQRLDLQVADLQLVLKKHSEQAADGGHDGAAQSALIRHHVVTEQLADLIAQRDALAEQEAMLMGALAQLQARVSGFEVSVQTLNAARAAAVAHQSIAASLAELSTGDAGGSSKESPFETGPQ
ncbi:PspA/IM30 family protein [Arthrobacter cryoconiti]|uniref:PspA/IM30 family protein n=1 Tax=Arthrobacter cryoconiti TaxID=748907 RepID=A0ABV8R246_9MICC|nr:hypothetical protein [Arthrobacter cryoconiti]MCC9067995.1 hypothetical protein [Arthrobacter cryoconiti]